MGRNLANGEASMLYPVIDYGGASKGIMASEFPLLQKCIAVATQLIGPNHWIGRLINLIVSCLGFLAFHFIVRKYFGTKTALFGTIALLFSIWLMYSRKAMPDTFSVALVLCSFYFYSRTIEQYSLAKLVLATVLLSLGVLSKIPALLVAIPIPLLLLDKRVNATRKIAIICSTIFAAIPVFWWYFNWVPKLVALDNNPLFFPRSLSVGFHEVMQHPWKLVEQLTFHAFFSFLGFGLFLFGAIQLVRHKVKGGLVAFLISMVVFSFFILKTGVVFPFHSYYMIPIIPIMACCVGYGLSKLKTKLAVPLLMLLAIESLANQQDDFRIRPDKMIYLELETVANSIGGREQKVVCNGGPNPQMMYFLNRKGWSLETSEINDSKLEELHKQGCRFFYFRKDKNSPDKKIRYHKIYSSTELDVYDITNAEVPKISKPDK